jgi:hypothetical protein
LSDLSETYDIKTIKGYFPHHFNTPENQNYVGKIPSEDYYGVKNMTPSDYKKFKEWYETVKDISDWNFSDEFIKYCEADVDLLAQSVLKFRKIFKTMLDVDPFRYVTLPSLCMDIFKNKFMVEKSIVSNSSNKPVSQVCKEWLLYLDNKDIMPEVPIKFNNKQPCELYKQVEHTFTVDGFDKKNKTVWEFQGCYHHGCKNCYPDNVERYDRTIERKRIIEENGYKVNEIWECEWTKIKKTFS